MHAAEDFISAGETHKLMLKKKKEKQKKRERLYKCYRLFRFGKRKKGVCFHSDVKESGPFSLCFQPGLIIRLEERQVEGPQRDSWSPQQQPGGVPAGAFLFPTIYLTFPSLPFPTPTFYFIFLNAILPTSLSLHLHFDSFFFGCGSSSHILSILFVSSGF